MIRILNAEPLGYDEDARQLLRERGELVEVDCDRAELLRQIANIDVLIVRLRNHIDREVFDAAPRLRVVVSATTGLNHIDMQLAEERGVTVLSLRGETEFLKTVTATAEHSWGLLLALLRHIPAATAAVAGGEWERDCFRGRELREKTLGIIGCGRLGAMVARYGLAFEMRVLAVDPAAAHVPDGVKHCSLSELLTESDVISVHVPLNAETTLMIDQAFLDACKVGAVLVNTSRGEVIDEVALISALRSGRLVGAALDVVSRETSTRADWWQDHPLRNYLQEGAGNLLITPHVGGATTDSMLKTERYMAQKLCSFLDRGQRS